MDQVNEKCRWNEVNDEWPTQQFVSSKTTSAKFVVIYP
jgi:hypothetical protein